MKIVSWNVNGLRSVMSKTFAEFLESVSPDVLCLQETKVSREVADSLEIPFKYKIFSCADKKGYSGTAIFSDIEPVSMRAVALEGHPEEGRITVAEFEKFNLVNAYVPNSQDGLKRLGYRAKSWDADFSAFVKSLKNAIVCGDLNVARTPMDVCDPKGARGCAGFTEEERENFEKMLSECGLRDVWRDSRPDEVKYTWWSYFRRARERNRGWRIDYFLVSRGLLPLVKDAELLNEIGGSDHCPITLELESE